MKFPDIVEVARQSGVPASTLRFYEEKGLVASVGRRGLKRLFDPGIFERLALISLARASGFALDEIRDMLAADGRPSFDRARLTAKAEELDRTIERLIAMREGLRHAAACPAPSLMECPTFCRMVRLAGAGALELPPKQTFKAEQVSAPALPVAAPSAGSGRRR